MYLSWQEQEMRLFSSAPRLALETIQTPIQ